MREREFKREEIRSNEKREEFLVILFFPAFLGAQGLCGSKVISCAMC